MLIDSHCHLNLLSPAEYGYGSLTDLLEHARHRGVCYFLNVGLTLEDVSALRAVASSHDDVGFSVGLHPNERPEYELTTERLLVLADAKDVVAIGETGLDYFRQAEQTQWQQLRFRRHIQVANQLKKPLIVHTREAREDTIRILQEEQAEIAGGVLHCFTETWEMAEQAMALGFYISFSGIVTFKNAKALQEVAKRIPLQSMLIETDSPYLAPAPHRGKPNQPAYVREVAEFLAVLKGVSYEELVQATHDNFQRLFLKNKLLFL